MVTAQKKARAAVPAGLEVAVWEEPGQPSQAADQRRMRCPPDRTRSRRRALAPPAPEVVDFKALLKDLRAERRAARERGVQKR